MKAHPPAVSRALEEAARDWPLFEKGRPLLVAVSGGADSLALLHGLAALPPPADSSLIVAHVHHGIRGPAADRDAAFVRARCRLLRVPYFEKKADVPALAQARGLSLEMAAREVRYAFFGQVLGETGASAVATAHTADDQAETVLLRLLRGAGPRGLGAMLPRARVQGVPVVRPFLCVTRREVEAYLTGLGKRWREDRTNADPAMLRNRVRHELLPLLEKRFSPGIREILRRTADILREEEEWLLPQAEKALARLAPLRAGGSLRAGGLEALPRALSRRVIRLWLMREGLAEEFLDFDLAGRLESLRGTPAGSLLTEAGGGWRVVSEYGVWRLEPPSGAGRAEGPPEAVLAVPGETLLPEWGLKIRIGAARGFEKAPPPGFGVFPCCAWLDAGLLEQGPLRVRSWRAGDRIALPAGRRKLQDLFMDAKAPRARRPFIPVLASSREVLWVAGGPVAVSARVPGPTAPSLRVDVERL